MDQGAARRTATGPLTLAERAMITHSLDLAGQRCADPTGPVYERLFRLHPQMEPLFVRDTNGAVRGEMLAKVFEVILDLLAERRYAANMIRCEVVTHAGYGVPEAVFPIFFEVVADTVRDLLEETWTADLARAWAGLLDDLTALAR